MTHQLEVNELEWKIVEYKHIIDAAQLSDFKELQETFRNHRQQRIYSDYLVRLFNSYKAFTQPNSYIFTIFADHIDAKADIGKQQPLTPACSR